MSNNIEGKVVFITGASSGNGAATARQLAQHGAKLVLGARRLDRLRELAAELALGDDAAVQTDVTQYDQVKHLVDYAVQTHGRIDVLINNAGLMPHSPRERGKIEECGASLQPSHNHQTSKIYRAAASSRAEVSGRM